MPEFRQKLTDAKVRNARVAEGDKETTLWDSEVSGFGLRVRASGGRSYIVTYRPAGQGREGLVRRIRLGTPETIGTVKEARRLALAALGRVASGADPMAERAEEKRRAKAVTAELLDRYERYLVRRQYVAHKGVMSLLRRRLAGLLRRDLATVTGWELAALIERIEHADGPSAAAMFRNRCGTFLNWCAFDARAIPANPIAGYRRGRDTRAERVAKAQRGRALSDAELAAVWRTADPETNFGRLVRFLILTGCRRAEGAGLCRRMYDHTRRRIDLPATFTKQARGHVIFVAPALAGLLAACPIDARNPDLLFPTSRTGGVLSGWSKFMDSNAKRTDKPTGQRPHTPGLVEASGVKFTLHDLRRTFRTGLSRLGLDTEIAELAIGHARADLEARYNRHDFEDVLRSAFAQWAEHVLTLTHQHHEIVSLMAAE